FICSELNKNPYLEIIPNHKSKMVYIAFSSVDIPRGAFMFWKIINRMDASKIFINDEHNGWYVHGIPGVGDVNKSIDFLFNILNMLKAEEVILIGPSMGGYGAMLYGAILKMKMPWIQFRCLSFGGEFHLYIKEARSGKLSKKPRNPYYADIRCLVSSSELDIVQVYGDDDINDIYQAHLVHGIKNIDLISVRNSPHAVSTYLGKKIDLTKAIKNYESYGKFEVESASNVSQFKEHGALLYFGHLMMLDNNAKEAIKKLEKAITIIPDHALTQHKLGLALLMLKKEKEALLHQELAINLNPDLAHAHFHIAMLSEMNGDIKKAEYHYKECIRSDERHIRALISLSLLYEKVKEYELALDCSYKVLAYSEGNKMALDIVRRITK
ncbi:hypothetical protein SO239_004215, partial [Escherichia coli]|nr:hypothetical protein [Escherichia coli]ELY8837168.1 hypothetical protein [Escherichia coli]